MLKWRYVQPNARAPETYTHAWEQQQEAIVFSNTSGPRFGCGQRQQDNMDMACDAMRLPRINGLAHWTDAPIYSQYDFPLPPHCVQMANAKPYDITAHLQKLGIMPEDDQTGIYSGGSSASLHM